MAVNVQSDAGDVANANSYLSVIDFKAYHDDRGNDYSAYTDTQIGQALVRATDYLDTRFSFRGIKLVSTQTTMWPRQANPSGNVIWWDLEFPGADVGDPSAAVIFLVDSSGNQVSGIPKAVKNATAEYALRALGQPLFQDAPAPDGGRLIDAETIEVDVIKRTISYAPSQGTGAFQMPAYPIADMMLARAGLIETGRTLYR